MGCGKSKSDLVNVVENHENEAFYQSFSIIHTERKGDRKASGDFIKSPRSDSVIRTRGKSLTEVIKMQDLGDDQNIILS